MVFSRIRELVGHPGEVVNKAYLYDRMMESGDPASARKTLPILVKYSRMMKDVLAEIQKVVLPSGTPRRVLYPGPPGSPTGILYEVVNEVALVTECVDGCGTQSTGRMLSAYQFRKSSGKDPLFPGETEEYRISKIRKRPVPCSGEDIRSVPDSGQSSNSNKASNSGSGGDSG